jgi:hypothetical protein
MDDGVRILVLSVLIALLVRLLWREILGVVVVFAIALVCAGALAVADGVNTLA